VVKFESFLMQHHPAGKNPGRPLKGLGILLLTPERTASPKPFRTSRRCNLYR